MYFINFSKCSSCKQLKSVASLKGSFRKLCIDCAPEKYLEAAEAQKSAWVSGTSNTRNARKL